ncbi:hypothetical protein M407DRAFT_20821 [Tulasnella calospora MUT 4182]|uniref:Transmembrane protein n=1 Tax=Tulasnella calospora MUT 4182 TaxID=1051891 RepID=A0A0C3QFG5_9AGAM|nr:hypothetical protein M407DRAFT_20821 [Tulasnella calospora MUT 4182]
MKRRAEISFYGRAVYIYGPPQAQLENLPGHVQLSLDGELLETIDLEAKYSQLDQNPVDTQLLYHWKSSGGDASHLLQISLLDSATGVWKRRPVRGFGLDSVVYTSKPTLLPKYELKTFEKMEKVTIRDTSFAISFMPPFAQEKNMLDAPSVLGVQTSHPTSNELAYNSRDLMPIAEFDVRCAALAIYGVSPAQLEASFGKGFRHGHIQICLGSFCDYVDLHHAYLNVPVKSWNEPVVLYSNDRMSPGVVQVVRMRFVGSTEMGSTEMDINQMDVKLDITQMASTQMDIKQMDSIEMDITQMDSIEMTAAIFSSLHQVISGSMRTLNLWISLSLTSIIWISLSLASTDLRATNGLTNTTLYSTHPQVAYAPESCCARGPVGRCKRYDPFTMSTYVDPNSTKKTFFQTSSWGNEPGSSNMKRRVEIKFYGRAVYVYGPPRAQLDNQPGNIQVSLNGRAVATIDLEAKYGEANDEPWNPQLMYNWESGAGDATYTLEISLLDGSGPIRGFGFDSAVFTSSPSLPPKYEPRESERLENVVIHDTNFVTTFTPSYAWQKDISPVASFDGIRTFHVTSNRLAYDSHYAGPKPVTKFTAQCAALAVYGASPAQLQATFGEGFRHGHIHICRERNCGYIDAHQAYLHVPEGLWNEPVLLYGTDRMSPSVLETVTMELLDPPSPVGHLWTASFSHAVCSQVVPRWPWTHPIPNGHYSTHVTQFDGLTYAPSFLFGAYTPWTRTELYSSAPAEPYWFSGMFRDMPSWSTVVRGHDIKIFVPSPALFQEYQYANVRCCIDERCHYPDIEQWLLQVTDTDSDVLLVHYQDLNPFHYHHISVTAVRRDDEAGEKIIAVSRVVYEEVVVMPPPSPTHSIPSKPTEYPNIPIPKEPVQPPDGSIGAFLLAALALAVLMGCFPQPLPAISNDNVPTPPPTPPYDISPTYSDCSPPSFYDAFRPRVQPPLSATPPDNGTGTPTSTLEGAGNSAELNVQLLSNATEVEVHEDVQAKVFLSSSTTMDPSMLRFLVWILLLLSTSHHDLGVLAQLVNTTLHSTHPQVTYAPEYSCAKKILGGCMERLDPFTMSTYVGSDSMKRTVFQTNSWGNEPDSDHMKRRVEISFYGRAVYVYGPPPAQLDRRPGHIQISLNGFLMEVVDLETKYTDENDEPWSPQLMYHWEGGGGDAAHTLQISLLDDGDGIRPGSSIRGFGVDSVVYTSSEPWRPPKYELSVSEKLENITIHDTNFVASFTPTYAWKKMISAVASSEGIRTFHGTSNELAYPSRNTGAALAIYGVSPAQLEATFAEGFRHGHLQLCEGRKCEYIDVHQAYLNVPEHLWNEPVLLYNTDRMSPAVSEVVTMRLLDSWSTVGHVWAMTLSHAVCSQVVRKSQWTHPLPDGHYSNHLVQLRQLEYAPSFWFGRYSPWSWMDLYSFAAAKPYSFFGLFGEMPSWSTVVYGHDIKIFVPFPTPFPASRYANVRCCIDGECHYPDVEQWYLKVREAQSNIPLVHYQDLNPFQNHRISMAAVRKGDEIGDKIMAVSQIAHQQVIIMPQPSSTPTPSKPTEPLPSPTGKEPINDPDEGFWAFALAALAVVILMSVGWCFALCLLNEQSRRAPERRRLINDSPPRPPRPPVRNDTFSADIRPPRPKYVAFEGRPGPGSSSGHNAYPGSSSASGHTRYEPPTSSTAGWLANSNSHHHDRGFGGFDPDSFPDRIVQPPHNTVPSGYQPASPLHSTTDQLSVGSPAQSARSAFSPTLQNAQPTSPTQTEIPPPYSDRTAPPSYDACVTTNAVIGSPPLPHDPMTVPAPPPPQELAVGCGGMINLDHQQDRQKALLNEEGEDQDGITYRAPTGEEDEEVALAVVAVGEGADVEEYRHEQDRRGHELVSAALAVSVLMSIGWCFALSLLKKQSEPERRRSLIEDLLPRPSPPPTNSDIPPPCPGRSAPPSYDSCVTAA